MRLHPPEQYIRRDLEDDVRHIEYRQGYVDLIGTQMQFLLKAQGDCIADVHSV